VREFRTPGSERGAASNRRPYRTQVRRISEAPFIYVLIEVCTPLTIGYRELRAHLVVHGQLRYAVLVAVIKRGRVRIRELVTAADAVFDALDEVGHRAGGECHVPFTFF